MPVIRKYEFDLLDLEVSRATTFDVISVLPDKPPEPPEPSFSKAEIEAAETRGFAAGRTAGEAASFERIEMRLAEMVQRLGEQMAAAADVQKQAFLEIERDAARLTMACLRKLFPVFLAGCETMESEALIAQAFSQVMAEPRLILRCPPDDIPALEPYLQKSAASAGFEGKLTIIADDKLGLGDCRIEWTNGGIDRDSDALLAKIEAVIFRTIDQRSVSRHPAIVEDLSSASPAMATEESE